MLHYILLHQVVHYIMIKQVMQYDILLHQVSNYLNIFSLLLLIGLSIGLSLTVTTVFSSSFN